MKTLFCLLFLLFIPLIGKSQVTALDTSIEQHYADSIVTKRYINDTLNSVYVRYTNASKKYSLSKTIIYEHGSITMVLMRKTYVRGKTDWNQPKWEKNDDTIYTNGKWTHKRGHWYRRPVLY